MTWSPEALKQASEEELVAFASQGTPTLRQMHAIRELASRAADRPECLGPAADAVVAHLGPRWRMGGLPVGYPGAQVLFEGAPAMRTALSTALAVASTEDRDDLLRWLQPSPRPVAPPAPVRHERELLIHDPRSEEAIRREVSAVTGEEAPTDALPLVGAPAVVAMVTLSTEGWKRLERDATRLSSALGTTVYWPPPAELGPLGPDLRVAVDADGRRWRVHALPIAGGYALVE